MSPRCPRLQSRHFHASIMASLSYLKTRLCCARTLSCCLHCPSYQLFFAAVLPSIYFYLASRCLFSLFRSFSPRHSILQPSMSGIVISHFNFTCPSFMSLFIPLHLLHFLNISLFYNNPNLTQQPSDHNFLFSTEHLIKRVMNNCQIGCVLKLLLLRQHQTHFFGNLFELITKDDMLVSCVMVG